MPDVTDTDASAKTTGKIRYGLWPRSILGRIALVAVAVIWVGSCVGLRTLSRKLVYVPGQDPVPATPSQLQETRTERVLYETEDGLELAGLWVTGEKERSEEAIVFFHGNAGDVAGRASLGRHLRRELETDVLIAAYRGYGGLEGEPTESGLYRDGRAAVRVAEESGREVILAGYSLGCGVAVQMAEEGRGRAVVLMGPFTSTVEVGRHLLADPRTEKVMAEQLGGFSLLLAPARLFLDSPLGWTIIADDFDSEGKIEDVQMPVYVVHGTKDEISPYVMGKKLSEMAPRGRLFTVVGGTHYEHYSAEVLTAFRAAME